MAIVKLSQHRNRPLQLKLLLPLRLFYRRYRLHKLLLLLIELLPALNELAGYNILDRCVKFGKQALDLDLSQFMARYHLQSD